MMLWKAIPNAARRVVRPLKSVRSISVFSSPSTVLSSINTVKTSSVVPKRLLAYQQKLPLLPVPSLQQTLDKFLISIQPLLSEADLKRAEKLAAKLGEKGGSGEKLQQLLEEKAKGAINWLEEWWLNIAYLEYRLPCPIYVNPGITTPHQTFNSTDDQIKFAAKLIYAMLEYKKMIDDQTVPIEKLGGQSLCMSQYYKILGACRIPQPKRDSSVLYPGDLENAPRHFTVLRNNHIFEVDVYGSDKTPLSVEQIYSQLKKVMERSEEPAAPVGILTSEHRDNWAQTYSELLKSQVNQRSLESIQRSIAVLALDKPMSCPSPEHRRTADSNLNIHGGGSKYNSANRWFDKTLQLIVSEDGNVGFNYEHSPAEGPPVLHLIDFIIARSKEASSSQQPATGFSEPFRCEFEISPVVDKAIHNATQSFDKLISDLSLVSFAFETYGKNFIKSQKMSPDAFLQVAFQLTYYRMYGHHVATYESGSQRKFRHGRTEVIRSCTPAVHAYCQAMTDSTKSLEQKADALRAAVQAHRKYTDEVVNGQGIDRHLLGLKLLALENDIEVPELLKDTVYNSSVHWAMSTSQVASKCGANLCFGPVVPNGYGICYNPMDEKVQFSVSSWNSHPDTDSKKFLKNLDQTLKDTQTMLFQAASKSKL